LRSSPISLFSRENAVDWLKLTGQPQSDFSSETELILKTLAEKGALFFGEIAKHSGLLKSRVEQALGELVSLGWVTADSFEGLRALLTPQEKRARFEDAGRPRRHREVTSIEFAGRWSLLRKHPAAPAAESPLSRFSPDENAIKTFARVLLQRYGVVFRKMLDREVLKVSWFELGRVYRQMEARGEIRGGHFISGVSGEQFALPEAIGHLRSLRKAEKSQTLISLSGSDPLNLVGILTPGARIPAAWRNRLLLRDGVAVAALQGGKVYPPAGTDIDAIHMAFNNILCHWMHQCSMHIPPKQNAKQKWNQSAVHSQSHFFVGDFLFVMGGNLAKISSHCLASKKFFSVIPFSSFVTNVNVTLLRQISI
jgi:ATP-dependent helicase Lhr and Lhr-like helicase